LLNGELRLGLPAALIVLLLRHGRLDRHWQPVAVDPNVVLIDQATSPAHSQR
jgi:hypothetical protein